MTSKLKLCFESINNISNNDTFINFQIHQNCTYILQRRYLKIKIDFIFIIQYYIHIDMTFEISILCRMYGSFIENGQYRKRTNQEIYQLFNKLIFSANLKSKISGQDGHIWRFEGVANTIFSRRLNEKRSRIRPKLRWAERVKKDHTEISHRTKTKGGEDEIGGEEWLRERSVSATRERDLGAQPSKNCMSHPKKTH